MAQDKNGYSYVPDTAPGASQGKFAGKKSYYGYDVMTIRRLAAKRYGENAQLIEQQQRQANPNAPYTPTAYRAEAVGSEIEAIKAAVERRQPRDPSDPFFQAGGYAQLMRMQLAEMRRAATGYTNASQFGAQPLTPIPTFFGG